MHGVSLYTIHKQLDYVPYCRVTADLTRFKYNMSTLQCIGKT